MAAVSDLLEDENRTGDRQILVFSPDCHKVRSPAWTFEADQIHSAAMFPAISARSL